MASQLEKLEKLGEKTYLLKGSPSTILYIGDYLYIVDPGHGKKRAKQIRKIISEVGKEVRIIVTHYHSDHLENIPKILENNTIDIKIISSKSDKPGIEDSTYRVGLTFGYPIENIEELLLFKAPSVKVDETIQSSRYGELEIIPLPGHTPGQIGVITPDNVFYAADSIFGSKVLSSYVIPYHRNPCQALETLKYMYNFINNGFILVPGHGPIMRGSMASQLIRENIESLERLLKNIQDFLRARPSEFRDILENIVSGRSIGSPGLYMLVENSLRGALSCLYERELIKIKIINNKMVWLTNR